MHLTRFILDVIALAVSFGLIEHGVVAHDEVGIELTQSCLSDASDSSELGSAESDVWLHHASSFEPHRAFDSGVLLFAIVPFAAIDVDPAGLRPPPSA